MRARPQKYGAVRTVVDGIRFASKREARRYSELKLLERAGEIRELSLQPEYDCVVNGWRICRYYADFCYVDKTGELVVEDAKGYKTAVYRLKKKLVEALYGIEIQEV